MSRPREALIAALRARGELWEAAPGLVGLRGKALALLRRIDRLIAARCAAETSDEWAVPAAMPPALLERAQYFASFPQWLTLASHLTDDAATLERVARSGAPARSAGRAASPATAALPPAVCYHVYAALAGSRLRSARV